MTTKKTAEELHKNVPPDWYNQSLKRDFTSWYWPLQWFWHNTRFKEIEKHIEPVKGKILDIGAADGIFTKVILDKSGAKKIIGIDVLDSSVNWANRHWKNEKRLRFRKGDAHKLKEKKENYDAVFALEVLEHVYDPKKVLKESYV